MPNYSKSISVFGSQAAREEDSETDGRNELGIVMWPDNKPRDDNNKWFHSTAMQQHRKLMSRVASAPLTVMSDRQSALVVDVATSMCCVGRVLASSNYNFIASNDRFSLDASDETTSPW